jgi:hypothetical protein
MGPPPDGEWIEHRREVFAELRRLSNQFDCLSKDFADLRLDVARLQTKAAIWGAGAGTVIGVTITLILKVWGS